MSQGLLGCKSLYCDLKFLLCDSQHCVYYPCFFPQTHNAIWCFSDAPDSTFPKAAPRPDRLTSVPSSSLASRTNTSHIPKSCPLFLLIVSCNLSIIVTPKFSNHSRASLDPGLFSGPHHLSRHVPWSWTLDPASSQLSQPAVLHETGPSIS